MIIYAFYGLGKTRFTQNNAGLCVDMDTENYYFEHRTLDGYAEKAKLLSDSGKIVFTNCRQGLINDNLIDIAFIPKIISISLERLIDRGVDSSFVHELESRQEEIMNGLKARFEKAIILNDDEYISNYAETIMQKYYNL